METVARYGRWQHAFPPDTPVDEVVFTGPDARERTRPAYRHQPARLAYEVHGYESVEPDGAETAAVRFTPEAPGPYAWRAVAGGRTVAEGAFRCEPSDHPGYVQRSARDPRYFAFTNGQSYCPIGVNLCWPVYYPLSKGTEFGFDEQRGTMGVNDYRRWFEAMAEAGGNYTRIWCSSPALNVETERAGVPDLAAFARLDAIVELARAHGIRLKLCLEHFRDIGPGSPYHTFRVSHPAFCKTLLRHDGSPGTESCDAWCNDPYWRGRWLEKVAAYLARYGDDPVVMAWELWNEIECLQTTSFQVQRDWTFAMLAEIKRRSPRNLVTNSLGSFDDEPKIELQKAFLADELDFQQVHRYLDQGAALEICRTDPVALSVDAVRRARRPDRPCLLTETGAVNDNHTGQFRYYRVDHEGLLLHDVTVAPLMCGSAGSGHSWFWEHYVEPKGLWWHLTPLARLIEGVALDAEDFRPMDLSTDDAWVLALAGRRHVLLWLRNKAHRWDRVLRDGQTPPAVEDLTLDLAAAGVAEGAAEPADASVIPCWPRELPMPDRLGVRDGRLAVPAFTRGLMLRLET